MSDTWHEFFPLKGDASMTDKPIVRYDPVYPVGIYTAEDPSNGDIYRFARLQSLDHPKLGATDVRTSQLVSYDVMTGRLETRNTVYLPELGDDE